MKILDRYTDLLEGSGEGYCIGLFLPESDELLEIQRIVQSYLNDHFPREAFYHQWMPSEWGISLSLGFPRPIPVGHCEELVKNTVTKWFHHLDSFGIKGASSIVYDEIIFSVGQRFDKFTGRAMITAFQWFDQLNSTHGLLNDKQHILALNPKAQDLLQVKQLMKAEEDPERSWSVLHYGPYQPDLFTSA
jgi:hypothetical protein